MENYILDMGKKAKGATFDIISLNQKEKNDILLAIADGLLKEKEMIFSENEKDIIAGREKGLNEALIDRLVLNEDRVISMSDGLKKMASLDDPIGEVISGFVTEEGLSVSKVRVPIGVIGMIYESRPNVTVDAMGLSFKSGNAIILRGGSEAINSNKVLMSIIDKYGKEAGMPSGACQLISDTDRKYVSDLITLNEYVDVIIPRGGKGLKKKISENATVPMIVTGAGLCHMFVDESYNHEKAIDLILNAKVQRPGVCNAIETLLIHKDNANELLPKVYKALVESNVEVVGCEKARAIVKEIDVATDEDFDTEYLSLKISIKIVDNLNEGIDHINKFSSNHSESILTDSFENAEKFLNFVDASTVYVNASTRFTDGSKFGLGGEIGIATQKLHARGPMGLKELTTYKYKVRGNGQIRK